MVGGVWGLESLGLFLVLLDRREVEVVGVCMLIRSVIQSRSHIPMSDSGHILTCRIRRPASQSHPYESACWISIDQNFRQQIWSELIMNKWG